MALSRLRRLNANNVATFRKAPLSEISGSLGDLGTLLPLMITLAINNSISLSTTLIFCGICNILTGVFFGIPLCVQPMKAIAAVAIARKFSIEENISAGFTTSGIVLIFSVTGLLRWFTDAIPIPVIKGIQVGAGLSLVLSAGTGLLQPLGWIRPNTGDNLIWVLFAFVALLVTQKIRRVPYALLIFVLGLIISILSTEARNLPSFSIWHPRVYVPSWRSFKTGALDAGLGQIPLTTLNSIIAVSHLSADLLPHLPTPDVTSIGVSVAMMNLIGGWFGAMPVCHGSGGLAGQYYFGSRSGASVIILGVFKVVLGLAFGESLVGLLRQYPKSLLGIMVIAAGLELAKVGESLNNGARDLVLPEAPELSDQSEHRGLKRQRQLSEEERKDRWMVMLFTVGMLLAFKNDGVGFISGMLCHFINRFSKLWAKRESRSVSQGQVGNQQTPTLEEEEQQLLIET